MLAIAVIALSYAIGAIPVAWLAGRLTRGIDIRDYGSGNVGASNVWQSVSRGLVVPVGLAQIAQGLAGPLLARAFDLGVETQIAAGVAAIVANDWNPFLGFTGGRGIGQSIGFLLVMSPVALAVFIIVALFGVAMRAIPQFVALAIVVAPLGAVVAGQDTAVVIGCAFVAAIAIAKRLAANGVPDGEHPRPQVFVYRLMYDRDVRDREAWVHRGVVAPPGQ
jgi:acyl phosphate:glycerol-3-phosphate acyltransferase